MISLTVLETLLSLTVQVTLLIGVTAWVARRHNTGRNSDICWAALHTSILIVTAAALLLPHLRLTTWADLNPAAMYPASGGALKVLGSVLGWTWATGALVLFGLGVAGTIKAMAIVRKAKINERLRQRMCDTMPGLDSTSGPIDVRLSDLRVGAFCWQIHRPMIALPNVVLDFPNPELAAIVRHEMAHLRRQHPLHLFMQRLVETIYWFHPLVWWASRQAAAAREICCDGDVVRTRNDAAIYLRSLLRLIELKSQAPALLPAGLGFLGDAALLSRRASLLADSFDRPVAQYSRWRPVLAMGAAVILCLVIWLPVNPLASRRAAWSPWPHWSARTLESVGIGVRDYEVDGFRLDGHVHGE